MEFFVNTLYLQQNHTFTLKTRKSCKINTTGVFLNLDNFYNFSFNKKLRLQVLTLLCQTRKKREENKKNECKAPEE